MPLAYEEMIDFLAGGITPAELIAFRPSEPVREHVADLLRREKTAGLTADETEELNTFQTLESILQLAKARARKHMPVG